jgi:hypothetical protein
LAAAPAVAFADLPADTRAQFTKLLQDGDKFLEYGDVAGGLDQFVRAYQLHPRNPDAVARIESLFARVVAVGLEQSDRQDLATLKENLDGVLAIDDFLGHRAALMKADQQLGARIADTGAPTDRATN